MTFSAMLEKDKDRLKDLSHDEVKRGKQILHEV